jgi:PPOX class probable F420-dependent enzyme
MTFQRSEMSQAQIDEFLQAPRFAIVGTNRVNGPPQLTPVWLLYENGQVYLSMFVTSAKFRNLRRDPRIGICVAAEHPDARAVMIYGTAELVVEESAWSDDIHWRLSRRYFESDEEAHTYQDSLPNEEESALAVVTPDKVIAEDFN